MLEVVVLPCVPDTAITQRSCSRKSCSHCGPEVQRRLWLSTYSTQGLPRLIALPITTRSGLGSS
ncbi:Uncharacterised protein [Vibrio cholerae]|nr:Uncharacterised protein [Vibrio cholerae]